MILVDTSVWIDHLHRSEPELVSALEQAMVVHHPMITGELALGNLGNRQLFLDALGQLPKIRLALHDEAMSLVDAHRLYGQGLALVDAHLLASALLTPGTLIWTRDKRLERVARAMTISA